jgi:spermidine synthase
VKRAPAVAVSERRGLRQLHIGGEAIQSAMRLDDPYALALDYTRCMMAFLLFHPRPRRALMIGLGGGSLPKYFHRFLRATRVKVIERDRRVLTAARQHFALPLDDARLQVEIGDGAEALAPECWDLVMVDGFDDGEQVPRLASSEFYDACYLALAAKGVLVANYMSDDPRLDSYLQRLERAFGGAVLCMPALSDPNLIAIALKGHPERAAWRALRARAEGLEARYALPFRRYVAALGRMNPSAGGDLIMARIMNGERP